MMGADVPTERSQGVRVRLGVPTCVPTGVQTCVSICVVLLFGVVAPAAAQPPDRRATLAAAKTAKCDFTLYTLGGWKAGEPQAEIKPATLSFRFEGIDADDGTARVVGPFGPSDIIVRLAMDNLHFMQSFREGPVYLTTIIARLARDGRWLAVHTRHEYTDVSLAGYTSRPEQYYGSCTLEP